MVLNLKRKWWKSDCVIGTLSGDDYFSLYTLEPLFPTSPKIPSGEYKCIRHQSEHLKYEVWMLIRVQNHDYVYIHIGNTSEDSDGCILVGKEYTGNMVLKSKLGFKQLMDLTKDEIEITLIIEN